MDANAPCRSLYVRNLPEKLQKTKLRRLLHAAFTTYGHVVWIVAEKTIKLRGQAFVTFEHQSSATNALRKMHGTEFMGRVISVTYAKAVTDRAASSKLGGDSTMSRKARAAKRRSEAEEAASVAAELAEKVRMAQVQAPMPGDGVLAADEPPPQIVAPTPPNRVLFVENLPKDVGEKEGGKPLPVATALTDLFARFAGFVEVRTVPGKDGIAFVEFSSEAESAVAMGGLEGHPLGVPPVPMKVTFAKK